MKSPTNSPTALGTLLLRLVLKRLFLPLVVLELAVLVGAGYLRLVNASRQQLQRAQAIALDVDEFLDQAGRVLDATARAAERSRPEDLTVFLQSTWSAYGHYDVIYQLGSDARIKQIVPADRQYLGLDMSNLPHLEEAQRRADREAVPFLSHPFISLRTGAPTIYVVRFLAEGGAMIGELSLKSLQRVASMGESYLSASELFFIMDQSGVLLTHPSLELVRQQVNWSNLEVFRRSPSGESPLIYDYRGTLVIGSAVRPSRAGWVVVSQIALATSLAPYVFTAGIALLASLLVWLMLAWYFRRELQHHVVFPIRQLSQRTAALTIGDFERVPPARLEISFAELDELAEDFQHMADSLRARQGALQESEERYRSLFDRMPIGLFRASPEGQFLDVNPACARIMGYPDRATLASIAAETLFARPEDWRSLQTEIASKNHLRDFEAQLRKRDGTTIWTQLNGSVIRDDSGQVVHFEGSLLDITDHKAIAEERLRAQKLESISLLAGGIAHDFNNFLTAMQGNLSLAKLHIPSDHELHDLLAESEEAVERATELTKRLLTFAKGGTPIKRAISLSKIIQASSRFALSGSTIRCNSQFIDDLWPVEADEGQLGQVFSNLFINAVQAMPRGGTITVACENVKVSNRDGLPLAPGKYVKATVADEGVGIPREHLAKVFDPYFTTKERGSGLGLAVVYSIVKNHGGHITVQSHPGAGTTFILFLPASESPVAVNHSPAQIVQCGSGRVLLMDDEESIRKLADRALQHLGYQVTCVRDGAEAIEVYRCEMEAGRPFDVVIMDLTIPGGLGGKETIERLRKLDPQITAIVSTGYSKDAILSDFRSYGFWDALAKPYSMKELSEKLANACQQSRRPARSNSP